MDKISSRSYAKVNLYLKILKKRLDGYHEIETVYQAIDLYDNITLSLIKKRGIKIYCQHPDVPRGTSNLAYKAAKLLLSKSDIKHGVHIKIDKNIPVAAGLGGGSSNAASVILGLNSLLGLNLKKKDLLSLASDLGSDVPFFILKETVCLGQGRGDKLKALKDIPKFWYILICPKLKISSHWAYKRFNLGLTKKKPGVRINIRTLKTANIEDIAKVLYNDLERAIEKRYTQVKDVKEQLKTLGLKAVLTSGSGPCVFGLMQSRREAMRAKRAIDKKALGWATFVCRGR